MTVLRDGIPYPSYANLGKWRQYQTFLPARLRFDDEHPPTETWWRWRGATLHLDHYPVAAAPATVILLHGGGGYGRLFAPFAQMLQRQGFEVIAPDLPGYGLTQAPAHLIDHDRWVDCVVDLIQQVKHRPDHPVVLLGCSLGGYLAYLAAARSRRVAGVIATTLADPRLPQVQQHFARYPRLMPLTRALLPVLDRLVGRLRLPIKWFANMQSIANQPALSKLFCQDTLGGGNQIPLHFLFSLLRATPEVEPEDFDVCPILLIHPAADRWTPLAISQPLFARLQVPKRLVPLENCGHFPVEEPGVGQLQNAVVRFLEEIVRHRS